MNNAPKIIIIAHLRAWRFSHAITPRLRYMANAGNETKKNDAFICEYTGKREVTVIIPAALQMNSTGNMVILVVSIHLC